VKTNRYSFLRQGKVRDVYAASDDRYLLIVASDRISAFDHVLPNPIPGKGSIPDAVVQFLVRSNKGTDRQPYCGYGTKPGRLGR
jgi:phosphoribosylaminoimidazole-succinocarboxamide synthase